MSRTVACCLLFQLLDCLETIKESTEIEISNISHGVAFLLVLHSCVSVAVTNFGTELCNNVRQGNNQIILGAASE